MSCTIRYGLQFGADCYPIHCAGNNNAKVADFEPSLRVPAMIETMFQQFANADRSAIHVLRKLVDLWPGKAGKEKHFRTHLDRGQGIS